MIPSVGLGCPQFGVSGGQPLCGLQPLRFACGARRPESEPRARKGARDVRVFGGLTCSKWESFDWIPRKGTYVLPSTVDTPITLPFEWSFFKLKLFICSSLPVQTVQPLAHRKVHHIQRSDLSLEKTKACWGFFAYVFSSFCVFLFVIALGCFVLTSQGLETVSVFAS